MKNKELNLDKNCGKCAWSTRDTDDLQIKCCLGITIENTWTTAHQCSQYADITTKKKKNVYHTHN